VLQLTHDAIVAKTLNLGAVLNPLGFSGSSTTSLRQIIGVKYVMIVFWGNFKNNQSGNSIV